MKKFILLGGLIVVVAAGFYINHRMKISNFNEKLQTIIGKDQEITETILKVESQGSQITFSELFELCDKSVNIRTEMLMELRGLYPNMESALKDSLREFLNAENELVRLKSQSYRKYLNLSSDNDSYEEALERWNRSSLSSREYYLQTWKEKLLDVFVGSDDLKRVLLKFMVTYNKLIEKEKSLENMMKKENLKFTPIFSKYQEANQAYVNISLEYAEFVKK